MIKLLNNQKNNYIFYYIGVFFIKLLGNIYFGGKVYGKENIPQNRCLLAGNHTSNFDSYLLFKSTNRPIHFVAKKELFETKFKLIFKWMHLIPVDRTKKNPDAKEKIIKLLNEDEIIGIFPEGTFRKKEMLLPFKPGVISFAEKTNSLIIPFAIKGEFKFRGKPKITFGTPIDVNKLKGDKIKYLENTVKDLLIK